MIKVLIAEHGKQITERSFKYFTVKDIHLDMRKQFGKTLLNSHVEQNGKFIVNWNFKKASVRLEGDIDIHLGYRTQKGK